MYICATWPEVIVVGNFRHFYVITNEGAAKRVNYMLLNLMTLKQKVQFLVRTIWSNLLFIELGKKQSLRITQTKEGNNAITGKIHKLCINHLDSIFLLTKPLTYT